MLIASLILAATVSKPVVSPTARVLAHYESQESKQLVPMLLEVLRFPTHQYDAEAHVHQKAWLMKAAADMGFVTRDAGKITEIELPGPVGAPILGLVIHGDVQPADAEGWSFPPFEGRVENGSVLGRGAADDKGPLIQTLLAMKALAATGLPRTHTIRLLVGSEEESAGGEMPEYLKTHAPPDYSLVLDSEFPVVVGEKAWDGLAVVTPLTARAASPFEVESINAGLAPSIVPDRAEITLRWKQGTPDWTKLETALRAVKLPEGTRLASKADDKDKLQIVAYGKSAHAGVNLTGGRNALVALARALDGQLPAGGADDLFRFVRLAGQDLHGTGLGITDTDPIWGQYAVNIATVKPKSDTEPDQYVLFTNLRRIPPRTAAQAKAHLEAQVAKFNQSTGAALTFAPDLSYFGDEPLGFDPNAKIVKRLMGIYSVATGEKNPKPAISGGGTYAKRLPHAIAFGMWFPGKPYPGHDSDEKIPIADLHRGARVLIHALVDIATGPKIDNAFAP